MEFRSAPVTVSVSVSGTGAATDTLTGTGTGTGTVTVTVTGTGTDTDIGTAADLDGDTILSTNGNPAAAPTGSDSVTAYHVAGGTMDRLLLVDGHANLYRAHFAMRSGLSAPDGTPTGAAYGFLRMLHRLLSELEPSHVGVAFDVGRETFRTRMDRRYKAQRKPMPEELRVQVPLVKEALGHMGIPVLELPDYEADDVMGTLAFRAAEVPLETVIASSDKDLLQLVRDPWIRVWHTRHERMLDEAGVEELFGVPPAQVPEVLALMGDSSDNVPGCRGVGEKGAKALIRRWGSVAALYDHLPEVEPKRARTALEKHRDEVILSLELVRIRTDLDIPLDLEALRRGGGDSAGLADLYRRLGFDSLLAGLDLTADAESVQEVRVAAPPELAREPGGVYLDDSWCAVAGEGGITAARTEAHGAAAALAPVLGPAWSVHGSKELLRLIRDTGNGWAGAPYDVQLAAYLLNPGEPMELEAVARRHLTTLPPTPSAPDPVAARTAERALWILRLREVLEAELEKEGLDAVYRRIEAPLVPVLEAMERTGILVDLEVLEDLSHRLAASMADLEREIHAEAGGPFNIASPQQLAEVMFERLGYPVLRRTAKTKRPSTNVDVLKELAARGYRLPALILEYREQAKLKGTYVEALPRQVGPDGRIHSRFHQTVTATGRLSSSDPNLQNIPVRTELGREIRRAFTAPPGFLLLAADYSQIELRILAHMSGDATLTEAFRRGEDIHRATAAAVLDKDPDRITPEERRAAKTVNFGLIYGMGAYTLSRDLGIAPAEAQRFIDAYFQRFPGVRRYMDELRERARAEGRVSTLFGRIRRIANLDHPSANVRAAAERMAINAPIQGTAADIIKLAMIQVHSRLEGTGARLLLQVHDELVLEVPESETPEVAHTVKETMEQVVELRVPMVADIGTGPSWYDAK